MIKRALSCLLALSLWAVAPQPALAAVPVAVQFEPTRQALVLQLPAGVVPTTLELNNPPRFVVDLPGTYPVRAESFKYPQGLVTGVVVARRGDTTRIVLQLRRPINGAWSAELDPRGRLVFVLPGGSVPTAVDTPRPVTTPRPAVTPTPAPTARPQPRVTPTPRPTVRPTAAPTVRPTTAPTPRPTARPTARPTVRPTATPAPSPRPIPPISPSPVPTLPPPAVAPSPVQVLPSPLPMPADDNPPMVLPTPAGEVPMILPTPAGEAPRTLPSVAPSAVPTARPTARPTPRPTPKPSARPAARPSATPAPARQSQAASAVKVGRIAYDEDTRFLTIGLSGRVTPTFTMLEGPARLVIDLPSATLASPQTMTFPGALVTEVAAVQADPTTTRVTLTLARPVGQNWAQRQTPNSLILIFDRLPVQE